MIAYFYESVKKNKNFFIRIIGYKENEEANIPARNSWELFYDIAKNNGFRFDSQKFKKNINWSSNMFSIIPLHTRIEEC